MSEIIDEVLNPGYGETYPGKFTEYDTDPLLDFNLSGVFFDGGSPYFDDESECQNIQDWIKYGLPDIDNGTIALIPTRLNENLVKLTTTELVQTYVDVPVLTLLYRGELFENFQDFALSDSYRLFLGFIPLEEASSISLVNDGVVIDTWADALQDDVENLVYFDLDEASYTGLSFRFGISGPCEIILSSMELRRTL